MEILQYFIIFVFCFKQCAARNTRSNRRLSTVENRLDVIASEISNFRDNIADIWDTLDQSNQTGNTNLECSTNVAYTNETINTTMTKFKDFTQTLISAFQAEKQARLSFQQSVLERMENHTSVTIKRLEEHTRNLNNGHSKLEHTIQVVDEKSKANTTAMKEEIYSLKLRLSDLTLKYENLFEMNRNLVNKISKLENCQPSWYPYLNSCYYLSRETVTWFQALEWCRMNQAQLVEYGDMNEVNFVLGLSRNLFEWSSSYWAGFWVGADDIDEERNFKWSTSHIKINSQIGLQHWLPGQPDNIADKEDCMMTLVNNEGQWNDDVCQNKLRFACEMQKFL